MSCETSAHIRRTNPIPEKGNRHGLLQIIKWCASIRGKWSSWLTSLAVLDPHYTCLSLEMNSLHRPAVYFHFLINTSQVFKFLNNIQTKPSAIQDRPHVHRPVLNLASNHHIHVSSAACRGVLVRLPTGLSVSCSCSGGTGWSARARQPGFQSHSHQHRQRQRRCSDNMAAGWSYIGEPRRWT
jgi:hypothetical protein